MLVVNYDYVYTRWRSCGAIEVQVVGHYSMV